MSESCPPSACETCPVAQTGYLRKLGVKLEKWDYVVTLAGNPNTGKSTIFNALTGLRQHTGNWPGKTITRAEGGFEVQDHQFKLVDLPGTYSLLSTSADEEVARDFILFGRPDVTLVVVDATRLERNLNLVLQVLQITNRVIVVLNLMDEAEAHGIDIDPRGLARDLGVPVVPTSARYGEGIDTLSAEIARMAEGRSSLRPRRLALEVPGLPTALGTLTDSLQQCFPGLPQVEWIALRLLEGDRSIQQAIREREFDTLCIPEPEVSATLPPEQLLDQADALRWQLPADFRDRFVEYLYGEAARISERNAQRGEGPSRRSWTGRLDKILTHRWTGIPSMILVLAAVLWITIIGANVPSQMLATLLLEKLHPLLKALSASAGLPFWLDGVLIDGVYLTGAWVVSVMLPPMAIFFPLFTILEDFGYLPRIAFNLDNQFRKAGAHGKQALTMAMGFGCNAAGVIATRIIESPRERLIAIITNNFALCNGRWPTQILIASIFIGALVPKHWAGLAAAGAVLAVTLLGVALTLLTSRWLSRTVLRGEVSSFSLELPPYRPPRILQTLYTSLIDRTIFVLWRALVFALPAGVVIWGIANLHLGGDTLARHLVAWLETPGGWIGLNGVILLAYLVAIPANEIVIPTILMLTIHMTGLSGVGEQGAGVMFEVDTAPLADILQAGGWTLLTAICLMLFSLCHNPCSTTIYTIYKETKSLRWTTLATLMPLVIGVVLCGGVSLLWHFLA